MTQYWELSEEERKQLKDKALSWYKEHQLHVNKLVHGKKIEIAPSGSDMFRPELWKAIHWVWFFKHMNINVLTFSEKKPTWTDKLKRLFSN